MAPAVVLEKLSSGERPVVAGSLRATATVETPKGIATLWSYRASDRNNAEEVLLTIGEEGWGIGGCAPEGRIRFCMAGVEGPGTPFMAAGAADSGIASVRVEFADGTATDAAVQNGYWVLALPGPDSENVLAQKPESILGLSDEGAVVVEADNLLAQFVDSHNRDVRS